MRIFLLIAVLILVCTSCYTPRYMYSPAAQNVPVLLNKGDSKLSAAVSSNLSQKHVINNTVGESKNRGFDLQAAYAVTHHFAVAANYFNRRESNNGNQDVGRRDSSVINYKRQLTEMAVGYFTALDENKLIMFQVFAGIGSGQFSFKDVGQDENGINYNRMHEAGVTRYYFQPALMLRSHGNFAASFSSRFSFIKFGNIKTDYTPIELSNYRLDSLTFGTRNFWEPAFTNTFGFTKLPGIQFEYQLGTAILLNNRYINHRDFNFSFAIVLDLPKLLTRKTGLDKN